MARPNNRAAITAKILGLKEAKAAFQKLPEVARDAYNWATEVTLSEIARSAMANLQKSPSIRTRTLLDSIGWSLNRNSGQGKVGIKQITSTVNVLPGVRKNTIIKGRVIAGRNGSALTSQGARVIRPTRYGHLVEFGHGGKAAKAEPFMRPAVTQEQSHFLARCRDAGSRIERDMANVGSRTL